MDSLISELHNRRVITDSVNVEDNESVDFETNAEPTYLKGLDFETDESKLAVCEQQLLEGRIQVHFVVVPSKPD